MSLCNLVASTQNPTNVVFPTREDFKEITLQDGAVRAAREPLLMNKRERSSSICFSIMSCCATLGWFPPRNGIAEENAMFCDLCVPGPSNWSLSFLQIYSREFDVTLTQPGYYAPSVSNKTEVSSSPFRPYAAGTAVHERCIEGLRLVQT